jgi:hypothetical protein
VRLSVYLFVRKKPRAQWLQPFDGGERLIPVPESLEHMLKVKSGADVGSSRVLVARAADWGSHTSPARRQRRGSAVVDVLDLGPVTKIGGRLVKEEVKGGGPLGLLHHWQELFLCMAAK